jgi:hypothetical protein
VALSEHESRDGHIGEIVDNEIEALTTEPRQHGFDVEAARQRAVNGVHEKRDPQPDEDHLPVGVLGGQQRQQRQHGAKGREHMDGRCQEPVHAPGPNLAVPRHGDVMAALSRRRGACGSIFRKP